RLRRCDITGGKLQKSPFFALQVEFVGDAGIAVGLTEGGRRPTSVRKLPIQRHLRRSLVVFCERLQLAS
ncbi:MAG: hypothetical protein ACK58L_00310, partial [Planctomycetota bacterium]